MCLFDVEECAIIEQHLMGGGEDQFVLFEKLTFLDLLKRWLLTVVYLGHEHRPKTLSGGNKTQVKVIVDEITFTCIGRLLQRKSQMFELPILLLLDREEGNIS